MGMYDYLNDEQVKCFPKAIITLPDTLNNSYIYYSGGSLHYFKRNSKVTYCQYYYNYGKNFNIIDFFSEYNEGIIIHIIRNGRNRGFLTLNNELKDIFKYPCYDDRGNKLLFKNKEELLHCFNMKQTIRELMLKQDNPCFREFMNYFKNSTKEERETIEGKKIIEDLENKVNLERKKHDEELEPYLKEQDKYYLEDNNVFEYFGALVYGLVNLMNSLKSKENLSFFISDERLVFIVCYNEMIKLLKINDFIKNYQNFLNLPEKMYFNLLKDIDKLMDYYKEISSLKFTKENFNEQYALKDILNGRYKEYYLKYNILPYENFDYSIWE